ncbi:membrane protein insertion efficiency factor YidD [Janthinobacterium fluminis]|uniref:Membrane protein insertion efficiency factor YidD n=1 Tax=Janthinobacterium fluminis TaxID=2987524 RepID=A0ABT5K333_9BURK|nr:membrane protein insertion efficiency factor YidD [Janthinobacterium fluminis]MDC8759090.1 membrane protein insertion efficiency factor YidD [Janthinobacterium fluminis]
MRKVITATSKMMQKAALAAISAYQRHLSPLKGYACAFRVHEGGASCSAYGRRVIARYGVARGMALLRRRLHACAEAQRRHQPSQRPLRHPALRRQAGFCDAPCDCDVGSWDAAGEVCDCLSDAADLRKSGRNCRSWTWRCSDMPKGPESRAARRRREREEARRSSGGDTRP